MKSEIDELIKQISDHCDRSMRSSRHTLDNLNRALYNTKGTLCRAKTPEQKVTLGKQIQDLEDRIEKLKVPDEEWQKEKKRKIDAMVRSRVPSDTKEFEKLLDHFETFIWMIIPRCQCIDDLRKHDKEIEEWIIACCHYFIFKKKMVAYEDLIGDNFEGLYMKATCGYYHWKAMELEHNRLHDEAIVASGNHDDRGKALETKALVAKTTSRIVYLKTTILTNHIKGKAKLPVE